ncbi:MAG TPA: dephospho-CoA kinase, partial [Blastocatellia bacterium]|nr:dephospho-CoA kinase [Blastocatellia bacterium]
LEKLNSIVHPRVFEAQNRWFAELERQDPRAIAIFDAALMIETGSYRRFDKVVVVYCDPDLQLERLMNRNRLTREEAMNRISAQMPTTEKLNYADFTIDTSNGFEETRRQVEELYGSLRRAEEAGGHASESAAAAEGGEAEPQPQ